MPTGYSATIPRTSFLSNERLPFAAEVLVAVTSTPKTPVVVCPPKPNPETPMRPRVAAPSASTRMPPPLL